ncbi:LAMI_0E02630g1_1 [Lachancea mirantina]|uniref:LAMI_0E02630g1_1 n=1 Tax=Lachancea mirantina TaxID=1230905 RepID=A0A1G4JJG6_9SACH|nr:LAMI_0E02630g1_1 [Lachancea mirantina]
METFDPHFASQTDNHSSGSTAQPEVQDSNGNGSLSSSTSHSAAALESGEQAEKHEEAEDSHNETNPASTGARDSKPRSKRTRATGEALNVLKREFDENPNPNAQNRKRISELTGLPEKNVRIWFQNRRAKYRKSDKQTARPSATNMGAAGDMSPAVDFDRVPIGANHNYCFVDANSLVVGSWKRLKSGNLKEEGLQCIKQLSNLSPMSINEIMADATDLIVIISKKNLEINYFFSAIANNTKILFRIFFPIATVIDCSISYETESLSHDGQDESEEKNDLQRHSELKLNLSKPPKFAVYFSDASDQLSSNQWSICDDFSEGTQVSQAFLGGSNIPHILSGMEDSLKYLTSLIHDYNSVEQDTTNPNKNSENQMVDMHGTEQTMLLHPEPQALIDSREENFFDDYQRHNEFYGLKDHDPVTNSQPGFNSTTMNETNSFHPQQNGSEGNDHLVPPHYQEQGLPKTPDFFKHASDLNNDEQGGLNNLLIFDDQGNSAPANGQNFF